MTRKDKGITKSNVLELNLTKETARQCLSEIASNHSERVILTNHAREKMRERDITIRQIFSCLKNGRFKDEPFWNLTENNWQMTLETTSGGDVIGISVALNHDNNGNKIIIITAYNG